MGGELPPSGALLRARGLEKSGPLSVFRLISRRYIGVQSDRGEIAGVS